MKVLKTISIFIFLLICFSSCKKNLKPSDYVKWVRSPENGLRKVKTIGEIELDLQYKPVPFIISNEMRKNEISQKEYDGRANDLNAMQYYTLKIAPTQEEVKDLTYLKVANKQQHQERLYYYSYLMQDDLYLVDGSDTLDCKLYHYERSFDLSKHRNFVLAFEHKKKSIQDKVLVLDSKMFGTGPIKIKINKEDLANLPDLKIKS